MITNTGKGILAKYLVGQAPAYASYIALGCGPKPFPEGYDFASPTNASTIAAMADPRAWALEMLGFPPGTVKPSKREIQVRFLTLYNS